MRAHGHVYKVVATKETRGGKNTVIIYPQESKRLECARAPGRSGFLARARLSPGASRDIGLGACWTRATDAFPARMCMYTYTQTSSSVILRALICQDERGVEVGVPASHPFRAVYEGGFEFFAFEKRVVRAASLP